MLAAQECSVLLPFEDLRAARASLLEFSETKAADPVRFLENSEAILTRAGLHRSGWTRTIKPQLKGTVSTRWRAIKVLYLSWEEFWIEILENFDNAEIQIQLRAEIVSVRQSPYHSLTEFVLAKNQLAQRVNTRLSETQVVSIVAGLARDEFRTHLQLHRPNTFAEWCRIMSVLDPAMNENSPPAARRETVTRNRMCTRRVRESSNNGDPRNRLCDSEPKGPCRYCGELHWNSQCPHRPTASRNGRGADQA